MPRTPSRLRVLFLCTGNSCRSQIAEGWARRLHAETLDAFSAGTRPKPVDPLAVRVMAEVGVDIGSLRSKGIESFLGAPFDAVITVCDAARESCPVFPGAARTIHRDFEDPPRLAAGSKNEAEALGHYRRVRDEIRAFVEELPTLLRTTGADTPDAT